MRLLIKNGLVEGQARDILVVDGKIAEIGKKIEDSGAQVYDAKGNLIMPGLVDVHVHFREPGFEYKETIASGTAASARGGFTTVFAMPNLNPVPDNAEAFKFVTDKNATDSVIKTYQYAAISGGLTDEHISEIEKLATLGAVAFTNDGKGVQTADTMLQAMQAAKRVGKAIVAHIEDDSLLHGGVMNAGPVADKLGLPGMTGLSESSQLARDLVLAQATGVHYHVAHISTKESVELVRIAKAHGIHVTAEVSPHHLLLDDSMIDGDNAMMKMNPPLRAPADRQALIAGLLDGTIDMIATDHAPHGVEEKAGSMRDAAFGITGIETAFALIYTHFVKSGLVDIKTAVQWMATKPAQAFNVTGGELKIGAPADIAIFDTEHKHTITADEFVSKGKNTPFIGNEVYGTTVATFVDGQQVYGE